MLQQPINKINHVSDLHASWGVMLRGIRLTFFDGETSRPDIVRVKWGMN